MREAKLRICGAQSRSRSRSFALSARRATTGPVETHRGRRRQFELSQSVSYFTVSRSALPPPPAKLSPLAAAATCSRKYVMIQFMTKFLDKLQYCIQ